MSRDMRKAIITVLICGIAWLIVGAILTTPAPQSIREWGAFLLLAMGWFAIGFGLGGGSGYYTAHKEDKEQVAKPSDSTKQLKT
jgi:hypothetical protein